MDRLKLTVTTDELLGRRPGLRKRRRPEVFVAYRVNVSASSTFRRDLGTALHANRITTVDGKVPAGIPWAPEIRKRIKRSNLIVADLTGPSKEVMFEFGFAGGKPQLTVVESPEDRALLPKWLTAFQMPAFSEVGTAGIAGSTVERLSTSNRGPSRPAPVPGSVVWLQNSDSHWCEPFFDRFQALCAKNSLAVQRVHADDLSSTTDLLQYLRAWLVVGCLDGSQQDVASHYFAGDVVSRQRAGSGSRSGQNLGRSMIMLVQQEKDIQQFVADAVLRVGRPLVDVIAAGQLLERAETHLDRHRRWTNDRSSL